jgi:hypothetical protein
MKDDFSISQKLQAKFGGNYFLMEQIFYLETGGQIWQGINLFMKDHSCPLYNLLQHHTKR